LRARLFLLDALAAVLVELVQRGRAAGTVGGGVDADGQGDETETDVSRPDGVGGGHDRSPRGRVAPVEPALTVRDGVRGSSTGEAGARPRRRPRRQSSTWCLIGPVVR